MVNYIATIRVVLLTVPSSIYLWFGQIWLEGLLVRRRFSNIHISALAYVVHAWCIFTESSLLHLKLIKEQVFEKNNNNNKKHFEQCSLTFWFSDQYELLD